MDTICKDYAILYKGLDHLHIWVSAGSWNQSLMETEEQRCILDYGVRNIMWIKVFLNGQDSTSKREVFYRNQR